MLNPLRLMAIPDHESIREAILAIVRFLLCHRMQHLHLAISRFGRAYSPRRREGARKWDTLANLFPPGRLQRVRRLGLSAREERCAYRSVISEDSYPIRSAMATTEKPILMSVDTWLCLRSWTGMVFTVDAG